MHMPVDTDGSKYMIDPLCVYIDPITDDHLSVELVLYGHAGILSQRGVLQQ